jgi:hypothetical protein
MKIFLAFVLINLLSTRCEPKIVLQIKTKTISCLRSVEKRANQHGIAIKFFEERMELSRIHLFSCAPHFVHVWGSFFGR